jgi:hypothetical protein
VQGNSVVINGNFSNGFTGWRNERMGLISNNSGWQSPPNPHGFGLIVSDGHDSVPCLKLLNDLYGLGIAVNDTGDSGACWQGWNVVPGQMVHIIYWYKTDNDGSHVPGLRCGWDGGTANQSDPADVYAGPAITVINCSVPMVWGCPTVAWGTNSWTKVEIYGTVNNGVYSMNFWIQAWNSGLPPVGTIGTGTDFAGAYVDDVFLSIT